MKTFNRIKGRWLIPLLMALTLFRPFSGFAQEDTNNFWWLELLPPGCCLGSWSFEDTNWDSDFGFAPLSYTNIVQVPDWDGNALQVDATNAAWLNYSITEYAPGYGEYTNLTLDTGSIEFWFVANWESADSNYYGAGPDDWGRFIDIGEWTTNGVKDWWSLYLNPSGTGIYFSSGTNGVRTNYLNTSISWDSSTWHMLDLTYSPSNSFIYVDGQLAASGPGVCYVPSGSILTNGFAIGSDFSTGMQQAHGQFDDLLTYNYQLSAGDVSDDYENTYPDLPTTFTSGGGFHPADDGPVPPGATNGGDGGYGDFYGPIEPGYGTNFFLTITNASNNQAAGWIENSSIYVPYTIFSRQSLLWPIWIPEATFYGSWSTNLTGFSISMLARNDLFLQARSEIAPRIIGAGNSTYTVLRRDGTVWAWGSGGDGQLGDGQWSDSSTPVQAVGLSNIVAIATPCTADYTLALDAYGKVWSWGYNYYGQLGRDDGLYTNENTPAIIPGLSNIVAIAGGYGHALALKSDGTVWAWGDNYFGELGNNNTSETQQDYAAPVAGLTNALAIASGDSHCFAICTNGTVWGWGYNEDWELGIGNADDQFAPVLVSGLTNVVALGGGADHSIALLTSGTIKAWGMNYNGEIGDIHSSTPVPVPGLSNIVSIACGGYHNLFINTNGNLYAWGEDYFNQFGDDGANSGSTNPYLLTAISNVTAIAGGAISSILSVGNGNVYTFGDSYEIEPAPTLVGLYTNYSSDGSGLPDWWEMEYFHHLGLDPNSDPVGDGWTLLQDYEQGYNPTNFITPPAITGLTVTQTNGQNGVTLTWSAETPTPLDYAIYRLDYNYDTWQYSASNEIGEVAGNVTTFTDNGSVPGGDQNSIYEAISIYGGGTSPISAEAYINSEPPSALTDDLPFTAQLVRNGTGRWQIMFSGIPTGIQTIQLLWASDESDYTATQEISASNIVNGVYAIPDSDVVNDLGTTLYAQGIGPDGLPGQQIYAGILPDDAPYFVDGRQDLKQNLDFVIRGASMNLPFGAWFYYGTASLNFDSTNFEEFSFLRHEWQFGPSLSPAHDYPTGSYNEYFVLDNLWPFEANLMFSNELVIVDETNQVFITGGIGPQNFVLNFATNMPAPPLLNQPDPYWIWQYRFNLTDPYAPTNPTDWGVTVSSDRLEASLQNNISNLFGLPYETGCMIFTHGTENAICELVDPGGNVMTENTNYLAGDYASWCPAPTLQFTNFYLAPLINPNVNTFSLPSVRITNSDASTFQPYPAPIDDGFNVTNQTPAAIFGSIGQPMILAAWAKYSIQGSSPTKYAFLGQYFTTNAYEVNDDGDITTTNAGIVSPYGEFFPTNPGPAALITMVNPDSGTQATGIVNVISLALDANHDGTINPTWNGPDFTSPSHPYIFWANNNYDRYVLDSDGTNYYDDDVAPNTQAATCPYTPNTPTPDCNYLDGDGHRVIPCARDLEDFTRLWVCGITSNLLAALPPGSTISLNWGDVGSPNSGNPTIDLFSAADSDGGIGYLTNSTIADEQVDSLYCPYIGRLGPGSNLVLNASTFANNWAGNHFIWCGVSNGTGGLNLTIANSNGTVLAQTTAYIQIQDIKQMYERWTIGDNPNTAPLTNAILATEDLPPFTPAFQYVNPPSGNTPYILYVHGWNMDYYDKDRFAEAAFKRLYWQGYQGRFGVFRWPTDYGFTGATLLNVMLNLHNYDGSEFNAWQSAQGLLNKLNDLNSQYPGHVYVLAHSMGNVVMGEALRLAAQNGDGQIVNTYVGSQAAIPAHVYDASVTSPYLINYAYSAHGIPAPGAPKTPNIYVNRLTNTVAATGRRISFYNVNDYALNADAWCFDQALKPDTFAGGYYIYNGSLSDPAPWNNFEFVFTGIDPPPPTYLDIVTNIENRYEALAYAANPYSTALGATPIITFDQIVDLTTVWPVDTSGHNYSDHFWHSAEFRGDAWEEWDYWQTLLRSPTLGFNISN